MNYILKANYRQYDGRMSTNTLTSGSLVRCLTESKLHQLGDWGNVGYSKLSCMWVERSKKSFIHKRIVWASKIRLVETRTKPWDY